MHTVPSLGAVAFPDTDVGSARGLVEETSRQMRIERKTKPLNSRRERDISGEKFLSLKIFQFPLSAFEYGI